MSTPRAEAEQILVEVKALISERVGRVDPDFKDWIRSHVATGLMHMANKVLMKPREGGD